MRTYPKIDTYFNRGPDFTVDTMQVRRPEFAAIDKWLFTEKIDGTNIRLGFTRKEGITTRELGGSVAMEIGGRTDRAQLPKPLEARLQKRSAVLRATAEDILNEYNLESLTLFGEGYGPGIQKGGGNYATEQDFVLFDVLVDDVNWLDEDKITETASKMGVDRVPFVHWQHPGGDTINGAVYVISGERHGADEPGWASDFAFEMRGRHEPFEPEGIVARPLVPLYDGRGNRIMWKLKGSDFRAGKR